MHSALDLLLEIMVFAGVVGLSLLGVRTAETMLAVRRRLADVTPARPSADVSLLQARDVRTPFFVWVQSWTSLKDTADRLRLRRDLELAGFEHPAAPVVYVIARLSLAIALPMIFLALQSLSAKPITGGPLILWALGACSLGLVLPRFYIGRRRRARVLRLEQEFPDALDLMVVCVEAGLGLEAALVRVGLETTQSHPRVAAELHRVAQELSAGRSRPDALRAMADRTGVEAVKAFVSLIIQTDALGGGVALTLKTFASEMRQTRFLKAEEKALRIPVLLTLPLIACVLPVVIVALLLPPIIDLVRNVLPAMSHPPH
jgi:tight adherence protein C